MNRFKILSVVLAVLFFGYTVVSASVIRQTRSRLAQAESKCSELESRCSELESRKLKPPEPVVPTATDTSPQPASTDRTIERLREMLEWKEMELAELSERYDSLQEAHDALQERLENMSDIPPEALERMQRFRDRMAEFETSAEDRELRREEFVQGTLDRLNERMVRMADDAQIQQNLALISDNIAAMADLRQQLREASDEETRQEIGAVMREQALNLRNLVRDERDLELAYVAKKFGVSDTEGFVQAVSELGGEFAFASRFMGGPGGRGRGFGRR
jgi:chromosome segregation ATPase